MAFLCLFVAHFVLRNYNYYMNELRQKRKALGLTQIQAANACGVSRRTFQTYEETDNANETYLDLVKKLDEMGILDGSSYVSNIKFIKHVCKIVFSEKYPEVECAYLFGSYARNEATGKSDIDILIVCPPMGMKFYGIIADLEEQLHKKIDLHTHREMIESEIFIKEILKEGIKIYGRQDTFKN